MKLLLVIFFGLEFGSFANVCIHRWPRGESILRPARSHCPWCKHQISWVENLPILSFIFLRAKCAHCGSAISWRYPAVEFSLPLVWVAGAWSLAANSVPASLPLFFCLGTFLFVLLVSSLSDVDWRIIPDEATFSLMAVGLVCSPWNPFLETHGVLHALLASIFGILAGGFPVWLIGFLGEIIVGREAMGGGDVKLMAGIGAVLGWKSVIGVLVLGSFTGAIAVGIGLAVRVLNRRQYIPFGPFLSIAAFAEFLFRCRGFSVCDIFKKIP